MLVGGALTRYRNRRLADGFRNIWFFDVTTRGSEQEHFGWHFMVNMVSEGLTAATFNFLTVGDTHEDVDHYFSMILSTVLCPHRFELREDLAELSQEMRHFALFHAENQMIFWLNLLTTSELFDG